MVEMNRNYLTCILLFLTLFVLSLFDFQITLLIIRRIGLNAESNPFVKFLISKNMLYFFDLKLLSFFIGMPLLIHYKNNQKMIKIMSITFCCLIAIYYYVNIAGVWYLLK